MPGYAWRKAETPPAPPLPPEPPKLGRPKGIPMLKPFDPAKCGTMPGWRQHRAHGQKECRPCMDSQNEYMRKYKASRRHRK